LLGNNFYYSQSSLGTYIECPRKFRYKYIEGWKENIESGLKEKIKLGIDFHILAERYFNGIDDYFYVKDPQLLKWINTLKDNFSENFNYKSEYEIKLNLNNIKIMAKYDLLVIKDDTIGIIDFKTNENLYKNLDISNSIQAQLYLLILAKSVKKIFLNAKLENISMEFFQLNFPKDKKKIKIKKKNLEKIEKNIFNLIKKIKKDKVFLKTENHKTCENCGFKEVCEKS
jgi:CRISPR/Cas system-associated exonuclease Cas4 (RecB family)